MTKPSRRRWVGRILSIALFSGAAWMLAAELRHHPLPALLAALRAIPPLRIGVSLVATALGYTALTGYDLLSLRYLGRRIPGRTVAFASFIGFAFANSLPFSLVTGASVRYRLYSDRGLSVADTTQLVALNTVTYVVGLLATAGVAFALQPILVPGFLRLPLHTARPLGVLCLLVVAAYLGWSAIGREPIRLGKWRLPAPNLPRAAAQVLVSGLDWTLSGTALYLLLHCPRKSRKGERCCPPGGGQPCRARRAAA